MEIKAVGVASDMAARDSGSAIGVWNVFYDRTLSVELSWENVLFAKSKKTKLDVIDKLYALATNVAEETKKVIQQYGKGAFFSGDHSGAIGIWSGVSEAKKNEGEIGLIWIDAHLDSHTPDSSHSKNIHGMPVALLMGQGNCKLNNILSKRQKIKPENVCFIGIRSYEPEEEELVKKLGCTVFYQKDVEKNGIKKIMQSAVDIVSKKTIGFGMSFDIDAFDPLIAPGTGYTEKGGLMFDADLASALREIASNKRFIGSEISEYIPSKDINNATKKLINDILFNLYP